MKYVWRWHYAAGILLLVLSFGYFYDFSPLLAAYGQLELSIREDQARIASSHQPAVLAWRPNVLALHPLPAAGRFASLMTASRVSGLQIDKVQMTNASPGETRLHLEGNTRAEQLYAWLQRMNTSESAPLLSQYDLSASADNQIRFSMDFNLIGGVPEVRETGSHTKILSNPFCAALPAMQLSEADMTKQPGRYSIRQMKMIGLFRQGHDMAALIQLPDGKMIAMRQGEILGKEQARIISVSPQNVRLSK